MDALVASRGADGEHEASRRLKTELFSEMDGIASSNVQVTIFFHAFLYYWASLCSKIERHATGYNELPMGLR